MAFVSINQPIEPQTQVVSRPINPTLMIGLGGSGKEVLLRLRRLIVERFGSLEALPCVRFMHLDTDQTQTANTLYDVPSQGDPLYGKIEFQPNEKISLKMDGGLSRYTSEANIYPHIKEWLQTEGNFADLGDLGDGAGQVRMASRLGFFDRYDEIRNHLQNIHRQLNNPEIQRILDPQGFILSDKDIDVYIVASLAGGTGSGTFLDMACLAKDLFPNYTRIGILFLPALFNGYPGMERILANGYAALMELNHYSFGHDFQVSWDGQSRKLISPPPFSYTYLIDGVNESGKNMGSNGGEFSLYQMVADSLFLDYWQGKFADMKRSTRINLVHFTNNAFLHNFWDKIADAENMARQVKGDTYTTRFGSFGLSAIHFPVDKVHNACAARLARDIIQYWENAASGDLRGALVTDLLKPCKVLQNMERQDIVEALGWQDQGAGVSFEDMLWTEAQSCCHRTDDAPKGEKVRNLEAALNWFDQQMGQEDHAEPRFWGAVTRQIETNKANYLVALKTSLPRETNALAQSSGTSTVLTELVEFKGLLPMGEENETFWYRKYFDDMVQHYQDEARECWSTLEQLKLELGREENSKLNFMTWKQVFHRMLEILQGTEEKHGLLYRYWRARVMKQVARRGQEICEEIDTKILGPNAPAGGGLIGQYYQLTGHFGGLKKSLEERVSYFSSEKHYAHTFSLYRHGDVDLWYGRWVGTDEKSMQTVLITVGNQLLADVFDVDTVPKALEKLSVTPPQKTEGQILEVCKKYLANLPDQPSALEMLLDPQRVPPDQQQTKVKQAYQLAKVWLMKAQTGLNHIDRNSVNVKPGQKPMYIGVDHTDVTMLAKFTDILNKVITPGDSTPGCLDVGKKNKATILFFNELQGVPTFYIDSVVKNGGLKESYQRFYSKQSTQTQTDLHTDKNRFKFGELVPKNNDEVERYMQALRAFVQSRLLGLLRVQQVDRDRNNPQFRYSYEFEEDFCSKCWDLGTEPDAIDTLYIESDSVGNRRNRILLHVEDVTRILREKRLLHVYLLLVEFYMVNVYPSGKFEDKDLKIKEAIRFSPQAAMLETERRHLLSEVIIDQQEKSQVGTAFKSLRGKAPNVRLTPEEYKAALAPYTREAGLFSVPGRDRATFHPVFVLDMSKIVPVEKKELVRIPPPPVEPLAGPTRLCPKCGKPIPSKGIFCKHENKAIARFVQCAQCGDNKIPDDLTECPSCGAFMPHAVEQAECQCGCGTKGNKGEPCPGCGIPFGQEPPSPDASSVETPQYVETSPCSPSTPGSTAPTEDYSWRTEEILGSVEDMLPNNDPERSPVSPEGTGGDDAQAGGPAAGAGTKDCPSCFRPGAPGTRCQNCNAWIPD